MLLGRHVDQPHWDLMIAHPPCTYLTNAAEWAYKDGPYHQRVKPETLVGHARRDARQQSIEFFLKLWTAPVERIVVENPVGRMSQMITPSQIVHPWMFGDDASKGTCLWIKGLPCLTPTKLVAPRIVNGKKRWANQCDAGGQDRTTPGPTRWKLRSKTYQGIADAMADQWG